MGTEPAPLTLADAMHQAIRAVDPTGEDAGMGDLLARFEDLDEPIAGRDVYGVKRAMALRYRAGRVLLAGDAAHLTNTRGGMNMNAGIHDAVTLAATLRAVLDGGPDSLLDAWAGARLGVVRDALLPRTDARVASPGEEVARMAALTPGEALRWAREASMLDICRTGAPA